MEQSAIDALKENGEAQDVSILSNYALAGVEFSYLKLCDITQVIKDGTTQVVYEIPSDLKAILFAGNDTMLAKTQFLSDELNTALAELLADDTSGKNKLETYIKENGGTAMDVTDATGKTSIDTSNDMLEEGLYLIVETKVPEEVKVTTAPFFVSLPMTDETGDYWIYDVTVYPKNQTMNPTIDKIVKQSTEDTYADTATASEGDTLDYRIVTKMPTITSEATYLTNYTFVDKLAKGITYSHDVKIAFFDSEEAAKSATGTASVAWDTTTNFTASYSDNGQTMTITMTETGLAAINPALSDKYMAVIYSAKVDSNAEVVLGDYGNENDVKLTYSRTNTTEENTIEDKALVYSYGIDLTKTFNDNKGDATAVQFTLQNTNETGDNNFVTATGSDGVYYVTGTTASETAATIFSPASDGTLKINGLEADTYMLIEIKTDDGYSLLRDPMSIEVTMTKDTITASEASVTGVENGNATVTITPGNRASAALIAYEDGYVEGLGGNEKSSAVTMESSGDSTNAYVPISVLNTSVFVLPATGGLGTILFALCGAAVVVAGALYLKKRNCKAA